ncbi:CDP-alcohol phosphatidyltransferase family protein [Candidatus Woesearchaeota archaeon]|nr:CDP-alcohol phosphatidyltransferase family protein [Candidatus Woesearchaeota archaeon]
MEFKKEINVPNALTLLRIILGPFVAYFILTGASIVALGLFVLALLTDFADGYLARRFKQVTFIGTYLDQWADKLLYGFVIFSILMKVGYLYWIIVYALGVLGYLLGSYFAVKKKIKVTKLGKWFIVFEGIILAMMILGVVNHIIISLFALLLVIPAVGYIRKMIK